MAKYASLPNARAVPRWFWPAYALYKRTAPAKWPLSSGARPWCDVRAVTFNVQPEKSCGTRASPTAVAVFREVAKHASLPRARRVALVVIGLRTMGGHCTGGRPLSFGARPWCDVRAVTSNAQPAFAWHARKRHCAGCLLGGGKTRNLAARARRAALVVIFLRDLEGHCTGGRPPSFDARPWCDVRAVASNT